MSFKEELWILLIDKALLTALAALVWHFYTSWQKKVDREQDRANRFEQEARELKQSSAIQSVDRRIEFLESSLQEFYWPLMLCMRKDDAIWHRVPALYHDGTQLPTETGAVVESDFLLPNHDRAVALIESQFHFVAIEDDLVELLVQYVRHVAVFRSLRAAGSELNPIDVDEPFPDGLVEQLQEKMNLCRTELKSLQEKRAQLALAAT